MINMLADKSILLVISGGIAAYKALELIRLIRKNGGQVRCILTQGGAEFITPLSVSALSGQPVYTDLWSLKDETEMGHIRLSREADLIVAAPASADFIAKMAQGRADDLASTMLLAADKPVLIAPAMNPAMWSHPATQANIETLRARGIIQTGPGEGEMACFETGPGRMAEPEEILGSILDFFFERPLKGYKALVTSGPTFEAVDPVRFLGNRSSGKQGHAIAAALAQAGADVTLVTGPVALPDPPGLRTLRVESAEEMLAACESALPADIAVCAAAVSDWRPAKAAPKKIKKRGDHSPPAIALRENPDILKTLARHPQLRPALVIGFAAETDKLLENAAAKLQSKGCDWILANRVGGASPAQNVFGSDENHVYLVYPGGHEEWPRAAKKQVARQLVRRITEHLTNHEQHEEAAE